MTYFKIFFLSIFLIFLFLNLNIGYDIEKGPQKYHSKPIPRTGGFAIYLAVLSTTLLSDFFKNSKTSFCAQMLSCFFLIALPIVMSGFLEDITKKIPPKWRLIGAFISALLFIFIFDTYVDRVNIPLLDEILSIKIFAILFTAFAITGVSHAFNIIDGFNGLASGVAILIFSAYAYIAYILSDEFILNLSLALVAATLGFFVWNYPFGKIFLGDGGAYFLGFSSASIGVLLVNRHPEVSPWFPLLLNLYPVWETLFSIYRRKFIKEYPPHMPDSFHLHQLIYKRITKNFLSNKKDALKRNYLTTPFLWFMELMCVIPAVLFWNNTLVLILCSLAFVTFYTWLYFRIVKFKTPLISWIRKG